MFVWIGIIHSFDRNQQRGWGWDRVLFGINFFFTEIDRIFETDERNKRRWLDLLLLFFGDADEEISLRMVWQWQQTHKHHTDQREPYYPDDDENEFSTSIQSEDWQNAYLQTK